MTVAELIAQLSQLPQDAEVRIPHGFREYIGETTDIMILTESGQLLNGGRYDIVYLEP